MNNREGVIRFQLLHTSGPAPGRKQVAQLIAWRKIFYQLQLIGADPARYEGLGFGNISRRLPSSASNPGRRAFLISGTQTGYLPDLAPEHFTLVTDCVPELNRVLSVGPIKPSSEAMTHASFYAVDPQLRFVIHAHSPHIWRNAERLKLPRTAASAECGTVAMSAEVRNLMNDTLVAKRHCFVMGGHQDGVIAFGRTMQQAGTALIKILSEAYQLS